MNRYLILLFFAFLSMTGVAQNPALSSRQSARLDSIATQDVPPGAPGVATGVVRDGQVIYERVAGYADLSDSIRITPRTRFNIASNGKQFTALAVLMLAEEGKVHLSDDIRMYLPTLYPDLESPISIEHLLNHSSGIRDVYDLWSLQGLTWWEHSFANADALALLERQRTLNFTPGTRRLYSNSNYILLAEIIAKASGESFVQYTTRLFQRLNMPHTAFVADYRNIAGPIARPYFNFDTWTSYDWIWNVCGDGNLFTTLEDQLTWEKVLQRGATSDLPPSIIRKSQELTGNASIQDYGYGLEFGTYHGLPYRYHTGATGAWKAVVLRFPGEMLAIVTMINTGKADPATQTWQMADVLLNRAPGAVNFPTQPAAPGPFVPVEEALGIYLNESAFSFRFVEQEGDLYLKRWGRNDIRLVRESDNVFHQWNDPAFKQEFRRNDRGEMEVTAYYTTHTPYTLTRENVDWSGFDFRALAGRFVNEETGVALSIRYVEDGAYQVMMAGQERPASLVSPTTLLLDSYRIDIPAFMGGKAPGQLLLHTDRTRSLRFTRID